MAPRLTVVGGPLQGQVIPLTEDVVGVGRDASNQICLSSALVSRRHCTIKKLDDGFLITDLESYNGTIVNGEAITERRLAHGDQISIGDTVLVFLTHQTDDLTLVGQVELYESELRNASTIQLEKEQAVYLRPERAAGGHQSAPSQRVTRDLATLLQISTKINSIRDVNQLQSNLLELIFEVVPAESGAILLKGADPESFDSVVGRHRHHADTHKVQVSRTITGEVLQRGVALLSNDLSSGDAYASAESLVAARTSSVLCAPITLFDETLGVIYLASSNRNDSLDEGHLQLVMAIASMAAVALENARHLRLLGEENARLQSDLSLKHNMLGESSKMRAVYQYISKVAAANSTVLILGENGTGKEQAARAIHQNSARARRPFIAINCAVLTEALLESELFGHERGAFTGAVAQKKGKLEAAEGGTVFLDEIGEIAVSLQAKLLRVLQEREFERVGGLKPIKLDVRIIAATNRDLQRAISTGAFRQDLYYRLNVVSFSMPPLRERKEDIPLLANHFVAKYSAACNRRVRGIAPEAMPYLTDYDWPGNVRELENTIERAVVLGSTDYILPEDLPESVLDSQRLAGAGPAAKYQDAVTEMKRQLITNAFEETRGVHNEAAKVLGMHPNNLHRLIKNLNLKEDLKKRTYPSPEPNS